MQNSSTTCEENKCSFLSHKIIKLLLEESVSMEECKNILHKLYDDYPFAIYFDSINEQYGSIYRNDSTYDVSYSEYCKEQKDFHDKAIAYVNDNYEEIIKPLLDDIWE